MLVMPIILDWKQSEEVTKNITALVNQRVDPGQQR
jgi:hypothetical protein